jgi:hypothetical protein
MIPIYDNLMGKTTSGTNCPKKSNENLFSYAKFLTTLFIRFGDLFQGIQ